MAFLSAVALAVAMSLDSLGVGVAYGLRKMRLPYVFYLIVAVSAGGLMALSMLAGNHVSGFLSPTFARRAGGMILVAVGLGQFYHGWLSYRQRLSPNGPPRQILRLGIRSLGLVIQILVEPAVADLDHSGDISAAESWALGLALGLDSLAGGFGAAMAGYPLTVIPFVAVGCAGFVRLGLGLGRTRLAGPLARKGFAIPGAVLMLVGFLRLL